MTDDKHESMNKSEVKMFNDDKNNNDDDGNDKDANDEKNMKKIDNNDEGDVVDDNRITPESDLSLPTSSSLRQEHRRIWVVTTAAMPWRTGTAVNPLLRALYLTRGRPKHSVTLMIPWLDDETARKQLYGTTKDVQFQTCHDQEIWIRDFCRTRAHCTDEEPNLDIQFYPSMYQSSFGSIFPTVDICSLIPRDEADVAILEEPEHLNWIRVPPTTSKPAPTTHETESESKDNNAHNHDDETNQQEQSQEKEDDDDDDDDEDFDEREQLGWAYKFRHVVGILHTNYAAYMKDYGLGTGIIAAPAISMLSSIVVRAYCHRVIRLSDVLPSLAPNKEVTCNVHGVRSEFLQTLSNESDHDDNNNNNNKDDEESSQTMASVYFIGKIIWAKGFDKVLELQELYKKSTGRYFAIDVYGSGHDEKHIARAFLGRRKITDETHEVQNNDGTKDDTPTASAQDLKALEIFEDGVSLRRTISERTKEAAEAQSIEVIRSRSGSTENIVPSGEENPFSIIGDLSGKTLWTGLAASKAIYRLGDSMVKTGLDMTFSEKEGHVEDNSDHGTNNSKNKDDDEPLEDKSSSAAAASTQTKKNNHTISRAFDPPRTMYELRRHPIPARFLGVRDHAELRTMTKHKIFLNMSITEVLCTTTAEALAMGKFAIIPKHPSNTFFLQFPNCLAYESMKECMEKLDWALKNDPTPLTDKVRYEFTWEGANERLYHAAAITMREAKERIETGQDQADQEVAWRHIETTKRGKSVQDAVKNLILPKPSSTPTATSEPTSKTTKATFTSHILSTKLSEAAKKFSCKNDTTTE